MPRELPEEYKMWRDWKEYFIEDSSGEKTQEHNRTRLVSKLS